MAGQNFLPQLCNKLFLFSGGSGVRADANAGQSGDELLGLELV